MIALLMLQSVFAGECPTTTWDLQSEWLSVTEQIKTEKAEAVSALEEYAFTLTGQDTERKGIRTDGLVVLQHGQILYENYGRGFTAENKHLIWSITKSVNSAILGRAVQEGLIDVRDSICDHVDFVPSENCAIRVEHLLTFSSGLNWTETYEGQKNQASSVLAMLYGEGKRDMATFVATHDLRQAPGSNVEYSSGDATLLSAVIGGAVVPKYTDLYPWTMLFEPLGIDATYERDAKGTYVGSSFSYMTPRDLAKLGAFYLNDGCVGEERLLPEGWVTTSTTPSRYHNNMESCCESGSVSGYSWWLNTESESLGIPLEYPDAPPFFYGSGHWGQYLIVIPDWDVIIVRTGDDRDGSYDNNVMVPLALALATDPSDAAETETTE
jgi:CubicO group peptidase (beta-lactamase class C family)